MISTQTETSHNFEKSHLLLKLYLFKANEVLSEINQPSGNETYFVQN